MHYTIYLNQPVRKLTKSSGAEKPGPLKRGRPTKKEQKKVKSIVESYYDKPMSLEQIAEETGFNIKTVRKHLSPLYKAAREEMDRRFMEKLRKEYDN